MPEMDYIAVFEKECYQPSLTQMILELDAELSKKAEGINKIITTQLESFFQTIGELQKKELLGQASTITISFLYTSLYLKQPQFLIELYESAAFLSTSLLSAQVDAGWLFCRWDKFYDSLKQKTAKAGIRNAVREPKIKSYLWRAAKMVVYYAYPLMKYNMRSIEKLPHYLSMEKDESFVISYGEYIDWQKFIYQIKPEIDIFHCEEKDNLTFRKFQSKWYENKNFTGLVLNDSTFASCMFASCFFEKTQLRDCRFIECTFKDCKFCDVSMPGASFLSSELTSITLEQVSTKTTEDLYGSTDFRNCMVNKISLNQCDFMAARFLDCQILDSTSKNSILPKDLKEKITLAEEEEA